MILFVMFMLPIICGILCPFLERINEKFPKWISIICIGIILVSCLLFWYNKKFSYSIFNNILTLNTSFILSWIENFNILFSLHIDKLSLLMITISGILGIISILCSWSEHKKYQGLFYLNFLFLFGITIGIFLSSDLFLFLFFWELTLIPMYFLVSIWGNKLCRLERRFFSSNKFFIYSQVSGIIMLISIISLVLLHYQSTNELTFNYQRLLHEDNTSEKISYILMAGFFLSFAIKMPIVPFHGWLIDLQQNSSISGSIELIGILLKISFYGIIKFCLPFLFKSFDIFSNIVQYIGIIGIFYGSFIAISQTNIKKFTSYINVIHMGFILITIFNKNMLSLCSIIIQMISYILSSSGLVIVCGQLHKRFNTYEISYMRGIWNNMQVLPAFLLFFFLSMIGIPGTGNFSSEIIALFGIFSKNKIIGCLLLLGMVFSSICIINVMKKIYYSNLEFRKSYVNITVLEKLTIFPIIILLLIFGIFPNFFYLNL